MYSCVYDITPYNISLVWLQWFISYCHQIKS